MHRSQQVLGGTAQAGLFEVSRPFRGLGLRGGVRFGVQGVQGDLAWPEGLEG